MLFGKVSLIESSTHAGSSLRFDLPKWKTDDVETRAELADDSDGSDDDEDGSDDDNDDDNDDDDDRDQSADHLSRGSHVFDLDEPLPRGHFCGALRDPIPSLRADG